MRLTEDAKGVYIIAATPFRDDGALDLPSIDRLVDFYAGHGCNGMTILGIMGESNKLTQAESVLAMKRFLARAGKMQTIVGVSSPGLVQLADLAKTAMDNGAAGVMVAPTPGLKGDDGFYNYFAQVIEALGPGIPVVVQDYPQTTGVYLSVGTFNRLVDDFAQVVMLKHEDSPGLAKLTQVRNSAADGKRRRVSILVGNGGLYLPQELQRGADGAMTGFAYPEMLVGVCERHARGDVDGAEDLFDLYLPLVKHEQQPVLGLAVRKEVLFRRGAIASAKQRKPGYTLTAEDRKELDRLMARLERRLGGLKAAA